MCQKEKLRVSCNFFFCHYVFKKPSAAVPPLFWRICSRRLMKTLWQKEKLLKTSNYSFCHTVFNFFFSNYTFIYRDFPCCYLNVFKVICCRFVLCGKGLTLYYFALFIVQPVMYSVLKLMNSWMKMYSLLATSLSLGYHTFI